MFFLKSRKDININYGRVSAFVRAFPGWLSSVCESITAEEDWSVKSTKKIDLVFPFSKSFDLTALSFSVKTMKSVHVSKTSKPSSFPNKIRFSQLSQSVTQRASKPIAIQLLTRTRGGKRCVCAPNWSAELRPALARISYRARINQWIRHSYTWEALAAAL